MSKQGKNQIYDMTNEPSQAEAKLERSQTASASI